MVAWICDWYFDCLRAMALAVMSRLRQRRDASSVGDKKHLINLATIMSVRGKGVLSSACLSNSLSLIHTHTHSRLYQSVVIIDAATNKVSQQLSDQPNPDRTVPVSGRNYDS